MKRILTPSLLLAAVFAAGSVHAAAPTSDQVTVSFHEADKFTDVRAHFGGQTDEQYLTILSDHLQAKAAKLLAPGQKLEITVTDVDLAGDFQPTNAQMQDVRIIKDIYLPRVVLSFRLLDEQGQVVKEGERRLSDLNFMNNISLVGRSDPLFYDKALLSDWLAREFKS